MANDAVSYAFRSPAPSLQTECHAADQRAFPGRHRAVYWHKGALQIVASRKAKPTAPTVKHLYTLLCNYAFAEAESGRYSFFGVFQNIELMETPGQGPPFFVAVGVLGSPGAVLTIDLVDAARTWIFPLGEYEIPPASDPARAQLANALVVIQAPRLEFPAAGDYEVAITRASELVHSAPFRVRVRETDDAGADEDS